MFTNTARWYQRQAPDPQRQSSMLLLLLLPFLLQLLGAADVPKVSSHVIKPSSSCPDVGYFFRWESIPNSLGPGACYLCFCQGDGTAVCWRRENRRCDVGSYKHKKWNTRVRRSPLGLADIFFRDAARDVFNKNTPESCKPFESSFSEGCPPADWCIGCTVCDCDANGRWDCHVLSFCPDKEDKKKIKTAKKPLNKPKTNIKKSNSSKIVRRTTRKPIRKMKTTKATTRRPNRQVKYVRIKRNNTLNGAHKGSPKQSPKPLIIRKDTSTNKPIIINIKPYKIKLNSTVKEAITQEVVKRVMSVMQRMFNKTQAINNKLLSVLPTPKTVQKRSQDKKPGRQNVKKFKQPVTNKKQYKKPLPQKMKEKLNGFSKATTKLSVTNIRKKREIPNNILTRTDDDININRTDNSTVYTDSSAENEIFNTLSMDNHYKYSVVKQHPKKYSITYEPSLVTFLNDYTNASDIKKPKYSVNEEKFARNVLENNTMKNINKKVSDSLTTFESNLNVDIQKHNMMDLTTNFIGSTYITNTSHTTQVNKILNITKYSTGVVTQYSDNTVRELKANIEKCNISKILNSYIYNDSRKTSNGTSLKILVFKKIDSIQNVLKNFLSEFRKNRTHVVKPRSKKINMLKYLKKFFRKIFRKRNSGKKYKNSIAQKTTTNNVIETICEIFGNCNKQKKNNKLLKYKVKALTIEAKTILRTIKIIKGLLHLLDFNTSQNNSTKFKDDIHKLNFILKDEYAKTGQVMTENQKVQINYIKSNTQGFIQAVGRFANILSDLIKILANKTNTDKFDETRNRRNIKNTLPYNNANNIIVTKELKKLKKLLLKYNLVQNTFMRKIYEIVNKFNNSHNNTKDTKVSKQNNKIYNSTEAIEKFSRNIIKNLRKLKNLVGILSSKTRRKRSVMSNDDGVEYLFTLMEYLLKQNYPLDAAPVNDGIDLLIEAIKNAPDIKPIQKKVLHTTSENIRVYRTTEIPSAKIYDEDSSLNSNSKYSKEDNGTSSQWVPELEKSDLLTNEFRETDFKFLPGKNIFEDNTEDVYDKVNTASVNKNKVFETALSYPIEKNNEEDAQTETSKVNIFQNKKFEVYSSDVDNEDSSMETSTPKKVTTTDEYLEPMTLIDVPTESEAVEVTKPTTSLSQSSNKNQQTSLDWLEEGYDEEVKDVNIRRSENITTSTSKPSPRTSTTSKPLLLQRNFGGISSITQEFIDEDNKKKKAKLNAEDVMYKKQMELLNSLDYGTERSELEDNDSRGREQEDVFSYYN